MFWQILEKLYQKGGEMSTDKKKSGGDRLFYGTLTVLAVGVLVAMIFFVASIAETSREPYFAEVGAPFSHAPVQYRAFQGGNWSDWRDLPLACGDGTTGLKAVRWEFRLGPGLEGLILRVNRPEVFPQLANKEMEVRRTAATIVVSGRGRVGVGIEGIGTTGSTYVYYCLLRLESE